MHITRLALVDFRSYPMLELAVAPGVTTFVGPNGEGKTNLVEAIGYLATLSSHRVATDAPLVRRGADRAVVRAELDRDGRRLLVELEINPGRANRARLNQAPLHRPRDVLGAVRTVLFAPEDLVLVRGEPGERRRFLDDLLVTRSPRYAGVRADYERVLRQRNALLKTAGRARAAGAELGALESWDAHLARLGGELVAGRLDLVEALRPLVEKEYDAVSRDGGSVGLDYRSSLAPPESLPTDREDLGAALLAELGRLRPQELERGVSLVGPHRDELALSIGQLPAKGYASHGESWSLALGLRLACYELLRAEDGEPVLLLDDVFAELDAGRRQRLAELVAPAEQLIVTAAVGADVPTQLRGLRYDVGGAGVRRAE